MLHLLSDDRGLSVKLQEEFWVGQRHVTAADLIMLWFPLGATAVLDVRPCPKDWAGRQERIQAFQTAATLPLIWSLVQGFHRCHRSKRPTNGYLATITSVLDLDCAMPTALWRFINQEWPGLSLCYTVSTGPHNAESSTILALCASHLANRRRRLTKMARQHLDQQDLQLLGLHHSSLSDILDGKGASNAWQALRTKGLRPPLALYPGVGTKVLEEFEEWSVYETCRSYELAEILFQAGHTPDKMVLAWAESPATTPFWNAAFVAWLLRRCAYDTLKYSAPCEKVIPGKLNVHLLSANFGLLVARDLRFHSTLRRMVFRGLPLPHPQPRVLIEGCPKWADECICSCTMHGCTPFTDFINQAVRHIAQARSWKAVNDLACEESLAWVLWFAEFIDKSSVQGKCSTSLTMAFTRAWSFMVLECRHTCCAIYLEAWMGGLSTPEDDLMPDHEEREEVQHEYGARLAILEKLQEDMEQKWLDQTVPRTLTDFVRDEWWPALEEAQQQLEADDGSLAGAIRGMESVGVEVHPVLPRKEEEKRYLWDDAVSDVSSVASKADEDEQERWQEETILAYKRVIDRICDREEPANGHTTEKGRWHSFQ